MRPFDREVNDGGDANNGVMIVTRMVILFPNFLLPVSTAMTILRTGKVTFLPSLLCRRKTRTSTDEKPP